MNAPLEFKSRPISPYQFTAGGSVLDILFTYPRNVGNFIITQPRQVGLGPIQYQETDATTGGGTTVFQSPQNVMTEFTVSVVPFFNPLVIVVCSDKPYPKLDADLFFPCFSGYDLDIVASAGTDPAKPGYDAGRKFLVSNGQFGPFKIPGNHIYFRVLQYDNTARYGGTQKAIVEMKFGTALPINANLINTCAVVTTYGF